MSISSQATEQKFPYPFTDVYAAIVAAADKADFAVRNSNPDIGRLDLSVGASAFSWGENVTVRVEELDNNRTNVVMESALKFGVSGSHRHHKNFTRLVTETGRILKAKKDGLLETPLATQEELIEKSQAVTKETQDRAATDRTALMWFAGLIGALVIVMLIINHK